MTVRSFTAILVIFMLAAAVSGQDAPLKIVDQPKPAPPKSAGQLDAQGQVILRAELLANGSLGKISIVSGIPAGGLTELAVEAAKQIKFEPRWVAGKPVDTFKVIVYGYSWKTGWTIPSPQATPTKRGKPAPAPTVDQIIDRFLTALGGRAAILNIKSHHATGTVRVAGTDSEGTVETYLKAPNKILAVLRLKTGDITVGFDGQRSWVRIAQYAAEYSSAEQEALARREADFYKYVYFRNRFPVARITGIEKVDAADTYVIEATPAGEKLTEKLYFSIATGLLVRRDAPGEMIAGKLTASAQFYDDYREVDGVKIAFGVRAIEGSTMIITKQLEIKNNVPIDDTIFSIPTVKPNEAAAPAKNIPN